jgi:TolB-like protein
MRRPPPTSQGAVSPVTEPSHAVFLSYASQDTKAAQKICEALRAAGIEVWFDQSELRGGDAWDQSIRKQIKTCALFLPLISKHTHERAEGYFRLEWKLAVDRSHLITSHKAFLLPVVIDETSEEEEHVPDKFREVQWTRLPGGVTSAAFVERVRRLLSGELSQDPTRTESVAGRVSAALTTPKPVLGSWRSKAVLLAAIAVVVVALGYFAANRLALSKRGGEVASASAFAPPPHSVAVLPFVNMSSDKDQEYFSDGVTEELLNSLAQLSELQVAARTSSFSFRGQNVSTLTIARTLNVGAILEGSVRRSANRVRITAQLVNAVTGYHMWSQTYDRDLTDILKVQADVATAVAQELQLKLAGDVQSRIELGGTSDPAAFDAYLQGQHLLSKAYSDLSNDHGFRAALASFDRAIARDPAYALAFAAKSRTLVSLGIYTASNESEMLPISAQARAAAERAVALAPELGVAHLALGGVFAYLSMDFKTALTEFDRALELAPGSAEVQRSYGGFAAILGHAEPGLRAAHRAVSLDPKNVDAFGELGFTLLSVRQFDQALTALRHAQVLDPDDEWIKVQIARTLLAMGEAERARQVGDSLSPRVKHDILAQAYYRLGRQDDAERELEQYKTAVGPEGLGVTYAMILAQWGRKDAALQALAKAVKDRGPDLQLWRAAWELDPLRNDPTFRALERRLNWPP